MSHGIGALDCMQVELGIGSWIESQSVMSHGEEGGLRPATDPTQSRLQVAERVAE